ncbi:MAG: hypothetical protein P1P77_13490 [Spirochaetaceae bacterium]|nr:hypothetical protein [Spirochaetaceae bacterium]
MAYPLVYPLTGPLLWWYARELGSDSSARPRFLPAHFIPYLAEVIAVTLTLIRMSPTEYGRFVDNVFAGTPPNWLPIRNALKVLVNLVYVVMAGRIAFGSAAARLSIVRRTWLRSIVSGATARLAGGSTLPFLLLAVLMTGLLYIVSLLRMVLWNGKPYSNWHSKLLEPWDAHAPVDIDGPSGGIRPIPTGK